MPSLKTLLQLPCGWILTQQSIDVTGVTIHLRSSRQTAHCTKCFKRSRSIHSRRQRRIQHLPCSGQPLRLVFVARHWYCRNPSCTRKIFAESLVSFADPHQQSSRALQNLQCQLGLIAGGEAGKRAATAVGLRTSSDTLLRRVINTPETKAFDSPHVGVDEWAWYCGHRYGTLIVNLDTHRPLALLPDRDLHTMTAWFRKYPEIQVISRDRGGIYAIAACEGAPQARQVADRWHLLKNIGDALERMMHRYLPLIHLVASELSQKNSHEIEQASPTTSLHRAERLKQQTRNKRYKRWMEVMVLHKT